MTKEQAKAKEASYEPLHDFLGSWDHPLVPCISYAYKQPHCALCWYAILSPYSLIESTSFQSANGMREKASL